MRLIRGSRYIKNTNPSNSFMETLKKKFAQLSSKITSITHVFGLLVIGVGLLLLAYDVRYLLKFGDGWDYINNIIVEAHGLLFDLIVLGVLISIFESKREKEEAIERDNNLIDDLRGWRNEEGTRRTVGAIKRLASKDAPFLMLTNCYLKEANLNGVILKEANFQGAVLEGALLICANLEGAIFVGANLQGACLTHAKLEGTDFSWLEVSFPSFERTNLSGANLTGACLLNADLMGTEVGGAIVNQGWFDKLEQWNVQGRNEIQEKYHIDENGILKSKGAI